MQYSSAPAVIWIGPQGARPTALEQVIQLLYLLGRALDAPLPDTGLIPPPTVREALRELQPELCAAVEGLAQRAGMLEQQRELFDDVFHASARGEQACGPAPELHATLAELADLRSGSETALMARLRAAAWECVSMDRAAAAMLAGIGRAQRPGNLVVRTAPVDDDAGR